MTFFTLHCCEGSRRFVACLLDHKPHFLKLGAETTSLADGVHALLNSSLLRSVNWSIPKDFDRVVLMSLSSVMRRPSCSQSILLLAVPLCLVGRHAHHRHCFNSESNVFSMWSSSNGVALFRLP